MKILETLNLQQVNSGSSTGAECQEHSKLPLSESISPVDGRAIASVRPACIEDYESVIAKASETFIYWRTVPAPKRGEIVRQIGNALRAKKKALGTLVSLEMGKSLQEGLGEVQEMIDVCDFAVGQSRQLYGFTMASERVDHRLYDQYHPLGVTAVISAFNFPVAVWSWNAMLACVCGNTIIWKPSSKTPLTAIGVQNILAEVVRANNLPEGLFNLLIGSGSQIGERMLADTSIPLVSVTGSTGVGRHAAGIIAKRFGRCILELGGNNAIILTAAANLKLAVPAIVFSAVGTAGQRCTTTRRLIIHESIYDTVKAALVKAYETIKIGNPLDEINHMGPLIDRRAVTSYLKALETLQGQGGHILFGGRLLEGDGYQSGCYVQPVLAEAENSMPIVQEETFAPILYLIKYKGSVENGIALQNDVAQGLSSSIFTDSLQEAETFLSAAGSDCGIANVNIGTSGAEIGGAFGGEKETGGGRESGSDAWKGYMRRQTNTINYGKELPLAQGIKFDI
ncbi:aldehyde dehydrogenase family protein [Desulfopila sp. IMCC35008]|uniref:L-piperidine-6-carboxylate dehydrogenase n=1 Tax=Desulfopila sp. IMCC35008 TaxID=2653858 RepID=UPI0013D8275B|nr:aldehyde dehydrogenase family protein [Desulfopila sp. IMCC35008]